jgi:hypothetical protein
LIGFCLDLFKSAMIVDNELVTNRSAQSFINFDLLS